MDARQRPTAAQSVWHVWLLNDEVFNTPPLEKPKEQTTKKFACAFYPARAAFALDPAVLTALSRTLSLCPLVGYSQSGTDVYWRSPQAKALLRLGDAVRAQCARAELVMSVAMDLNPLAASAHLLEASVGRKGVFSWWHSRRLCQAT